MNNSQIPTTVLRQPQKLLRRFLFAMPTDNLAQCATRLGRRLDQKLKEDNTAILADTINFETLSEHDFFSGSVITPARAFEAFNSNYTIWLAVKKVAESAWANGPPKRGKRAFISRVVDQVFLELAKPIGDRVAGPHVVLINYKEYDDISSIVKSAQRIHRRFTMDGVPRKSVIVSIPATEAGIFAVQVLQNEGMLTCLHFVTSLEHAQACVEAGVSAISVSVGPLLDMYERRRNTVYQDLSDHPGIEAIQSILAYFKINRIKTRVFGADFRNLAEIGLLSECDAVCVSAGLADKLSCSQVPTASIDLSEESQYVLRARQAKYPTDLLTRGGFSACFSPEAFSLTTLLYDALNKMQSQMELFEHVVDEERKLRMLVRSPIPTPQITAHLWDFTGEFAQKKLEKEKMMELFKILRAQDTMQKP